MVPLSSLFLPTGIPSAATVKTIGTALAAAVVLAGSAGAAPAVVAIEPGSAPVGGTITVTGPPGDVELEPLDTAGPRYPLGRIGAEGTLETVVPQVPPGSYVVIGPGAKDGPVLEVVAGLSSETSVALLAFGVIFLAVLLAAGIVVHRRWRGAIS